MTAWRAGVVPGSHRHWGGGKVGTETGGRPRGEKIQNWAEIEKGGIIEYVKDSR